MQQNLKRKESCGPCEMFLYAAHCTLLNKTLCSEGNPLTGVFQVVRRSGKAPKHWQNQVDLPYKQEGRHEGIHSLLLRFDSPSGKGAKLHTMAASNNRDHVPRYIYY